MEMYSWKGHIFACSRDILFILKSKRKKKNIRIQLNLEIMDKKCSSL